MIDKCSYSFYRTYREFRDTIWPNVCYWSVGGSWRTWRNQQKHRVEERDIERWQLKDMNQEPYSTLFFNHVTTFLNFLLSHDLSLWITEKRSEEKEGVMESLVNTHRPRWSRVHLLSVALAAGTDGCWQGSEREQRKAAPLTWAEADTAVMGQWRFDSKEGKGVMNRDSLTAEVNVTKLSPEVRLLKLLKTKL